MIQRVSETVSTAATLAGRWQQSTSKWQHTWTFHPTTQAARDCTPLLVFVNRGSGGRQGEATLVQMRALLSAQQVRAPPAGQRLHPTPRNVRPARARARMYPLPAAPALAPPPPPTPRPDLSPRSST